MEYKDLLDTIFHEFEAGELTCSQIAVKYGVTQEWVTRLAQDYVDQWDLSSYYADELSADWDDMQKINCSW